MDSIVKFFRQVLITISTLAVLVAGAFLYWNYGTVETVTMTVMDKERICDKSGKNCDYMIFTNNETFKNIDSIWHLKFNSSDVYGGLESKKKYSFTVQGFRIKILSQCPNSSDLSAA